LAQTMKIDMEQVSIKATTNEKLGPVGRQEGICAYAVVLLIQD
ncbi:MAG: 2-C-methyl-D-erythritol 2,4-cyclodiphosphate synthase, partial [Cyanobacteria bacterium J06600_6]